MNQELLDGKRIKKIKIIPYSHHDYAWVCTRKWHTYRYIKCFSEVVDVLEENPDFTWMIDNVTHSWLPFELNCPEKAEKFKQLVKAGRITIADGGYSLARPSYVGEETYIRNLLKGRRFFKNTFGIDEIPCLYNADTACGHSQVPQIAKLSGHKYYRFQRPDALLTHKKVPFQFNWKGLDGSEVLVSRGVYGGVWSLNDFLKLDFNEKWDEAKTGFCENWLNDKVKDDLVTSTVVQFLGSDDCRPLRGADDEPLNFNEFMKKWNETEPVKMEYDSINHMYEELEKDGVPVYEGVLDHTELSYNFPFKGNKSMWLMRILLDRLIVRCERTCMIAEKLGFEYPEAEIKDAWDGLFEITGHAIEFIMEENTNELYDMALRAKMNIVAIINRAERFICSAVEQGSEMQETIINTMSYPVTQTVRFEVTNYCGVKGFDILDENGNKLPYQIADCHVGYSTHEGSDYDGVDVYVTVTVPAMGYTTLRMVNNGESLAEFAQKDFIDYLPAFLPNDCEEKVCLENGAISAEFYRGKLITLKNLETGAVISSGITSPASELKFCEFPAGNSWYSVFNNVSVNFFIPEHWKILANGTERKIYKAYGKIFGQDAEVVYTLDKNSKGIDIEVISSFKDEVEGMLSFAVKADVEKDVYADIPFGTEKREFFRDLPEKVGAKFNELDPMEWDLPGQVYGRNWCKFTSQGAPVAIISNTCSVYYNFDIESGMAEIILNRNMPLKTRTDRWVSACPDSLNSTDKNSYKFSLVFTQREGYSDLQRYHNKLAHPLTTGIHFPSDKKNTAPLSMSLLSTDKENIIGTSFYREDSKNYFRFFECDGKETEFTFVLPKGVTSVKAVDFEDNKLDDVKVSVENGMAKINVLPFKIVTLILE